MSVTQLAVKSEVTQIKASKKFIIATGTKAISAPPGAGIRPRNIGYDGTAAGARAAFEWMETNLSDGDIVHIDELYDLSGANIIISGVSDLTFIGGGTIKWDRLDAFGIRFENCPGLKILNIRLDCNETLALWNVAGSAEQLTRRPGIYCIDCPGVEIRGVTATNQNVRLPLYLLRCDQSTVSNCNYKGFAGPVSEAAPDNISYCNLVFLQECRGGVSVLGCHAEEAGSLVLMGSICTDVTITGCGGKNLFDNGIYGSSADNCTVSGNSFILVKGTAVKMRGGYNTVMGNTARGCGIGFAVSVRYTIAPNSVLGEGVSVIGNIAKDCGVGIIAQAVDVAENPVKPDIRNLVGAVISGNQIFNCTSAGTEPLQIYTEGDFIVSNNIVNGFSATYGCAVITSLAGLNSRDNSIYENQISNGPKGLLLNGIHRSTVRRNKFRNLTHANIIKWLITNCDGLEIDDNSHDTSSDRIDCRTGNGFIAARRNDFEAGAYLLAGHESLGNKGGDKLVDIASVVPWRIGASMRNTAGALVMAKGTASTADWVVI